MDTWSFQLNWAQSWLWNDFFQSVFIYSPQELYTFAIATAVFDEFGLSIADARIIPLDNEYSMSMYTILEQDGFKVQLRKFDRSKDD